MSPNTLSSVITFVKVFLI